MLTGQERLVLEACGELAGHAYGFVLSSDIAARTGMESSDVSNCLLGLGRGEYMDLAPQENGSLKVSLTPRGRQELRLPVTGGERPQSNPSKGSHIKVIPKGLRSYDEHDADFFLELLPGPRRSDGLPESVHFWKTRIEETDPEKTFSVGVIFGPSGCGKSSLVKAGLLPELPESVIAVYVEATENETENRLLNGLRKHVPDLPAELPLKDTLAALKAGMPTKKVLIVIDQFEQWLHARRMDESSELAEALHQCDGGRVQAIVMVRDDFSMALLRFLKNLGIRFVEGQNVAVVDLFDIRHATKVLTAFGQAFGVLPKDPESVTEDQRRFLEETIAGLAQDGRVVSVRLALFAEMVKGDPWTPSTLVAVGGTQGVGVKFLERAFDSPSIPSIFD